MLIPAHAFEPRKLGNAMSLPVLAIVGRPNVGKSTLFNRLTASRRAIVEDMPGVTRDRQYGEAEFFGRRFTVIDTGGFEAETEDQLLVVMRQQAEIAMHEADVVLLLFDGKSGMVPGDGDIAELLKRVGKPVFFAVNKIDGDRHEANAAEFWELGMHDLYSVSAQHSRGVYDLMEAIIDSFGPEQAEDPEIVAATKVAVIGKPNAGKSTLLNRLLGEERLLVSNIPGTTRDSIDNWLTHPDDEDKKYLFIDTAGVRRRKWIDSVVEKISIVRTFKSIDRADCCLLLIDATEGVTDQDAKVANFIEQKGKSAVILLNKWDAVGDKDDRTLGQFVQELRAKIPLARYCPIVSISALTGQRVHRLFELIDASVAAYQRRVPTSKLNQFFEEVLAQHQPPIYKGRRLKIYYATQVRAEPPMFALWVNNPDALAESYHRYLLNRMRETFDFEGTPVKLIAKQKNPKRG